MKRRKILKWILWILVLSIIISIAILIYFSSKDLAPDKSSLDEIYTSSNSNIIIKEFEYQGLGRLYIKLQSDQPKKYLLCIIQGAPMSLTDFNRYFKDSTITSVYDLIMPERLGYGKNKLDTAVQSIQIQADFIAKLLLQEKSTNQKIVLMSHSYGGAIASVTAYLLDSLVKAHVMLSPVIDPKHEKIFWFSALPLTFPIKYFISKQLKTASIEKMSHANELLKVIHYFSQIKSKTYHYHGTDDFLAPKENIEFVKKSFAPAVLEQIIIPDAGHFLDYKMEKEKLLQIANDN